ncbi:DUF4864 domain-containing protein [Halogranum amylolyticum]|uniref:DUF4864 domain-containing protein n=1 Tax=Halogranum amylolyticum TaxID=660520 RepID=UPI0014799CF0|nr:DUF4864 domain-containing protein [Halogranum amylolyticum]
MNEQYVNHGLPRPTPSLPPETVVELQLDALRANDDPYPDSGIETAFVFASPAVRRVVGPLTRFSKVVRSERYAPLVDFDRVGTTPIERYGDDARQEVTVVDDDGHETVYEFRLARQPSGRFVDCWLTEAVVRIA